MPYNCTLKGECVEDWAGPYLTLDECRAKCRPYEGEIIEDILYDILSLNLEDALELAPADIAVVLFRATGLREPVSRARQILKMVIDQDYLKLWRQQSEAIKEYLLPSLDELDLLILDTVITYVPAKPDWDVVRRNLGWVLKMLFRSHPSTSFAIDVIPNEVNINSLDRLVELLQIDIAGEIYGAVSSSNANVPMVAVNGVKTHWDFILETYGPTIPYQRYIVQ